MSYIRKVPYGKYGKIRKYGKLYGVHGNFLKDVIRSVRTLSHGNMAK